MAGARLRGSRVATGLTLAAAAGLFLRGGGFADFSPRAAAATPLTTGRYALSRILNDGTDRALTF